MPLNDWRVFALGSALFAALTAIFGKIGVSSVNSNLATLIRTIVILAVIAIIVTFRKEWETIGSLNKNSLVFLVLSGLATGGSWLCYYHALKLGPASKVAPVDKLSVVFVLIMAVLFLGEEINVKAIIGCLLIAAGSFILAF